MSNPVKCPNECSQKYKGLILVKKGMAMKAFKNNIETGNNKRLEKQIKKGTVQYFSNEK